MFADVGMTQIIWISGGSLKDRSQHHCLWVVMLYVRFVRLTTLIYIL